MTKKKRLGAYETDYLRQVTSDSRSFLIQVGQGGRLPRSHQQKRSSLVRNCRHCIQATIMIHTTIYMHTIECKLNIVIVAFFFLFFLNLEIFVQQVN